MTDALLTTAQAIEAERVIAAFGDGVANVFEQLEKGNWTDDHGHDVRMNKAMADLVVLMKRAMKHRAAVGLADVNIEDWTTP